MSNNKDNNIDEQYLDLLKSILINGNERNDRTQVGTIGTFGNVIVHNMKKGFPLLTSKKMATSQIITELLWFMRGDTSLRTLFKDKNYIWLGDAYKRYTKIAEENNYTVFTKEGFIQKILTDDLFNETYGDCGKIYGHQWRYIKTKYRNHLEAYDKYLTKFENDGFYNNCEIDYYFEGWREIQKNTPYSFTDFYKIVENINNSDYEISRPYNIEFDGSITEQTVKFSDYYGIYKNIDQLNNLVNDLKNNPYSRRLMVNSWNVSDMNDMLLPPCHYNFQCYVNEINIHDLEIILQDKHLSYSIDDFSDPKSYYEELKKVAKENNIPTKELSLMWNQRSVDTPLGLPFNIASYGILLEILAKECGMLPNKLIGILGDTHIYNNQIEIAKLQAFETTKKLCEIEFDESVVFGEGLDKLLDSINKDSIKFIGYEYSNEYKYPLSN